MKSKLMPVLLAAVLAGSGLSGAMSRERHKKIYPGAYRAVVVKVTDSDTIKAVVDAWPGLQVPAAIRVYGVDTPEKFRPHCPYEKKLAKKATAFVEGLIKPGDHIVVRDVQYGKYAGRVVAKVDITTAGGDAVELGALLVARGYGRPYFGKTKSDWCADEREEGK